MRNDEFVNEYFSARPSKSDELTDCRDGSIFQNHPIFSENSDAFQIVCYYDDVEIVNPLGSKIKTHKLGKHTTSYTCMASSSV